MRTPGHEALLWAPEHLANEVQRRYPRCVLRWGVRAQKWVIMTPLNPWQDIRRADRDPWMPEDHAGWFPVLWISPGTLKGMRSLDNSILTHLDSCFIGRGRDADEALLREVEAEKAADLVQKAKDADYDGEAAEDADYASRARGWGPKTGFIRPSTEAGWSLPEASAAG